jgi:hypothetical protein
MTYHPSSAVSVATIMIAVAFTVTVTAAISYRTGRAHAAWRDFRNARHDVPRKRRIAWSQTRGLLFGALVLFSALFAAAWNAGH